MKILMHHIDSPLTIIRNIKNISYLNHTFLSFVVFVVMVIDIFVKIHGSVVIVLFTTYKKSFFVSFVSSAFITFLFSDLDANPCPLMFREVAETFYNVIHFKLLLYTFIYTSLALNLIIKIIFVFNTQQIISSCDIKYIIWSYW